MTPRPLSDLVAADWAGFGKRKAESASRGRLRGIGLGSFLEVTAPPNKESGALRFEADDPAAMSDIQDRFRRQLLALQQNLALPF